jgi:prepilin-type N-terminal cleavage/methylation domain-containing protein/prepilin-type processing-associated H-X9-DG protein
MRTTVRKSFNSRSGFTILELIVVISILALLLSLLLPAIQMAREGARRTRCCSNLRQISIAFSNYCDVYRVFPGTTPGRNWPGVIKPFLEISDEAKMSPIYACPSDAVASGIWNDMNHSYRGNNGVFRSSPGDGFLGSGRRYLAPSDILDGLSQTAAIGERLASPIQAEAWLMDLNEMSASMLRRRTQYTAAPFVSMKEFAEECEQRPVGYISTWTFLPFYNHIMPPNGHSCLNGPYFDPQPYAVTAGSEHPEGINIAMGDGSVRFVSNVISRDVWWAIGTRNGNEVASVSSL